MKQRLFLAAILGTYAFSAYASNNIFPMKCPTVSSIQSINLTNIERVDINNSESLWQGHQYGNKYDTNFVWNFTVSIQKQDNNNDIASSKLYNALAGLILWLGPFGSEEAYVCFYKSTSDDYAMAFASKPGVFNDVFDLNNLKFKR